MDLEQSCCDNTGEQRFWYACQVGYMLPDDGILVVLDE
jgi:hypothetical protein